jgi:hypothetical protein
MISGAGCAADEGGVEDEHPSPAAPHLQPVPRQLHRLHRHVCRAHPQPSRQCQGDSASSYR